MKKIIKKASELYNKMEIKERTNGTKFYYFKESNEKIQEFVRNIHGESMPDDFIYEQIHNALGFISELEKADDDEFYDRLLDVEADCYTSDLTAWLNSSVSRVYYLTEAISEFGSTDGFDLLANAQLIEIREIYEKTFCELKKLI